MKPFVLCVIIAPIKNYQKLQKKAFDSVLKQDYENFSIMVHYQTPEELPYSPVIACMYNCSRNRNTARKMALASDADYFFFLDSDIVLKPDALSKFMIQTGKRSTSLDFPDGKGGIIPKGTPVPEIQIQGGWYPIYGSVDGQFAFWPCGKFVADDTLLQYRAPELSLISTDFVGLGCCLMTRDVLSKIEFEHGTNVMLKNQYDVPLMGEESLAFGTRAFEAGFNMFMNGDVMCGHLKEGRLWRRFKWIFTSRIQKLRRFVIAIRSRPDTAIKSQTT